MAEIEAEAELKERRDGSSGGEGTATRTKNQGQNTGQKQRKRRRRRRNRNKTAGGGGAQLNADAAPFVPEAQDAAMAEQAALGSSEDGENESTGPLDEEWHVGLYGDEDYFSEDEEYDDQEELEDDLMDQFRAGLPSAAFTASANN